MRLTTKCRHAVTALIHLANQTRESKSVSLAEISRIQGVSLSYLEQLFSHLRKHEIVTGTRGPGGGYRLNGAPEEISIARIMDAIEDRSHEERMRSLYSNRHDSLNFAQNKWNEFSRDLYDYLSQINLGQFLEGKSERSTFRQSTIQPLATHSTSRAL